MKNYNKNAKLKRLCEKWPYMRLVVSLTLAGLLAACGTQVPKQPQETVAYRSAQPAGQGGDVVLYALGLIDTGYRFGGKNPEAGLDCSGMVSFVFDRAAGLRVSGSAADIARAGKPVERGELRPGDLVFFNTRHAAFSHVGIYIGDDRFVHAPASGGRVRIDHLGDRYFAQRYEAARSYFD